MTQQTYHVLESMLFAYQAFKEGSASHVMVIELDETLQRRAVTVIDSPLSKLVHDFSWIETLDHAQIILAYRMDDDDKPFSSVPRLIERLNAERVRVIDVLAVSSADVHSMRNASATSHLFSH